MNTQLIKTRLINVIGEVPVSFVQAFRFVYLLHKQQNVDPEIALLPVLLRQGDITIDVGANGGDWSYQLHKIVGVSGFVFAFEADPYYAYATSFALRLLRLKHVRLFPFGLSDKNEDVPLRVSNAGGLRMTGRSHIDRNARLGNHDIRVVSLKRLDTMVEDFPQLLTTRLIKCDVEGYELFVFRGAAEIIKKSRPIIILEIGNYEKQGYSNEDVFHFFDERDYLTFALTGEHTLSQTDKMLNHNKAVGVNRVLLPKEQISTLLGKIDINYE